MSKRSRVLELLSKEKLTTKDIHNKTGYDMDLIWQYINQFKSEGKIKKLGNEGRFSVYVAIKQDLQENENKVKNDDLDTKILKKLITPFKEHGIKIDLEEHEIKRIKSLWEEINTNA